MIPLANKTINSDLIDLLNNLQSKIDSEVLFAEKVKTAQSLWKSKGGSAGKKSFEKIKEELYSLCVYEGICNYCEQNEANDIEHIYPKSFFPNYTFKWTNYLLVCKQCNTAFKLDECYCINDDDSVAKVSRGTEPPNQNIAIINPRLEDPNKYMLLNLKSFKFEISTGLTPAEISKAKYTLEILHLDIRDTLLVARRSALRHYYDMLERLCKILNSASLDELKTNLSPAEERFDYSKSLSEIKNDVLKSYKAYISTYQHPSVWYSIKLVESKVTPNWIKLFEKIPDALNW
ncbi:hypothetical protein GALL_56460 [mine drainage metagenome]|uniref:HNH nuclease domain-containing protein n=1 Tax=mine drainage metagenome TaxID=410659 RepID=A0A1J5TAF4_9ZZZZ